MWFLFQHSPLGHVCRDHVGTLLDWHHMRSGLKRQNRFVHCLVLVGGFLGCCDNKLMLKWLDGAGWQYAILGLMWNQNERKERWKMSCQWNGRCWKARQLWKSCKCVGEINTIHILDECNTGYWCCCGQLSHGTNLWIVLTHLHSQ